MNAPWIRPLLKLAAAYDLVLGAAALLAFRPIYERFGVTLPNHDGYVQWGAAVVMVFGIGFWLAAMNPARNRDILIMGVLFKLAFAGTVLGHHFLGSVPMIWVPFAWADLVFALLFIAALRALPSPSRR
jgi:hypothetical protein